MCVQYIVSTLGGGGGGTGGYPEYIGGRGYPEYSGGVWDIGAILSTLG